MKVACIQMDVLQCRKDKNVGKALSMALEAVGKGAELIVLPEVFSTGFCYENFDHAAESFPSPTLENLSCFSEANDCILMGSFIEKVALEKEGAENLASGKEGIKNYSREMEQNKETALEKKGINNAVSGNAVAEDVASGKKTEENKNSFLYYNLGFCFESGALAGTYRKTHPFKTENCYFSRGNSIEPITLKTRGLKVGFEICYELRFPEIARKLALAGSDILVTTAAFPNPRSEHWKTLVKARAIENQVPHIACNRIGKAPEAIYFGSSMVVDAWGEVKAYAGHKECVIVHDLDLDGKDEIRKSIPVFEDRRAELYFS
ncbi:carbon-nitrogen family hydrolase [Methanosarcina sp. KYL-1]|uniref:nitrilase-related carbon-nitrogen hydrolase n=1 Tax=Methanosarcina sp. KYL-1 TaxID=2602068 RepID=UPI002101CA72|nr:nitrilase-related carbon-nitrogen hydrolase [Methanosarcina sp. KYL-1]MCQ1535618.1 carbon-nitrogen family hydrolase [Methanosarcina sp. KYL-1]